MSNLMSLVEGRAGETRHESRSCRFFIPELAVYIWLCDECRLKYRGNIRLKNWRLVAFGRSGEHPCLACSVEEPAQ